METSALVILIIVALIVGGFFMWIVMQRKRTERLRSQFGTEYDRTIEARGSRRHAESELEERQKRVSTFDIHPLSPDDQEHFARRWMTIQSHFVDEPTMAVVEADELLSEVMNVRGYPIGDFEQRAADLSVEYPRFVENYRAAHEIKRRRGLGESTTEDLRQAMIHYRALFEHLIEDRRAEQVEVRR